MRVEAALKLLSFENKNLHFFSAAAASAASVYFWELFSYVDGGLPIVRK
jgi:hypothetical protein